MFERPSLVDSNVVGFVALDEVLRFVLRGMVHVAFEPHIGNDFLHHHAANPARFGVPFDVIAALECLWHHEFTSTYSAFLGRVVTG